MLPVKIWDPRKNRIMKNVLPGSKGIFVGRGGAVVRMWDSQ